MIEQRIDDLSGEIKSLIDSTVTSDDEGWTLWCAVEKRFAGFTKATKKIEASRETKRERELSEAVAAVEIEQELSSVEAAEQKPKRTGGPALWMILAPVGVTLAVMVFYTLVGFNVLNAGRVDFFDVITSFFIVLLVSTYLFFICLVFAVKRYEHKAKALKLGVKSGSPKVSLTVAAEPNE